MSPTTSPGPTNSPVSRQADVPNLTDVLDCPVCMDLLVEPITISCGHTFCRPCLVEALSRSTKQCPTCRSACHVDAVSASESTVLREVILRVSPSAYQERLESMREIRKSWSQRHPIFFYNDIQFPSSPIQLVFFEPRYKLMMERVLAGSRCFIWLTCQREYRSRRGDIGVLCRLQDATTLPDGRYAIRASAQQRVTIQDTWVEPGTAGLCYGSVQALYDDIPLPSPTPSPNVPAPTRSSPTSPTSRPIRSPSSPTGALTSHPTPTTAAAIAASIDNDAEQSKIEVMRTYQTLRNYVTTHVPRPALLGIPELPELPADPTDIQLETATWRGCSTMFALVQLGGERMTMGVALLRMRTTRLRNDWINGCTDQLLAMLPQSQPQAAAPSAPSP